MSIVFNNIIITYHEYDIEIISTYLYRLNEKYFLRCLQSQFILLCQLFNCKLLIFRVINLSSMKKFTNTWRKHNKEISITIYSKGTNN